MRRTAFTLLEVLLAMSISVMLLGALYVAVNTHMEATQSAREVIEHSTLVRALTNRIISDVSANLGPVAPERSTSAATGTTATATTGGTGTTAPEASSLQGAVQFNLGVQGDSDRLTLYVSRVHLDSRFMAEPSTGDAATVSSDLRRVTYWLAGGADAPLGLARQVVRLVTAEDQTATIPPDGVDEASHILADEVRSLRFSYFDGTEWRDTWDGTALGADGMSPLGPPLAIAITFGLVRNRNGNGEGIVREYRHVVAIPTANGASQQTTGSP